MRALAERVLRGGAIELFTSHWRSSVLEGVDAVIVSISRGQPRWPLLFKYHKLPALAPGDEAWNAEDQEAFERAYLDQLDVLGKERVLADLEWIGSGRPVVMLCWEKPHEPFCHRWLLAEWLQAQAGLEVPELELGMIPQREGAAEPRLF